MSGTQAKLTGGALASLICWLWNNILCALLALPQSMQMPAEVGVAVALLCVALVDHWWAVAPAVLEALTAPGEDRAAAPAEAAPATAEVIPFPARPAPEPPALPDGGGKAAPLPFAEAA